MKTNKTIVIIVTIFVILLIPYIMHCFSNKINEIDKRVNTLENVEIFVIENVYSCGCVNQTIIQEVVNVSLLEELNATIQKQSKDIEKLKDELYNIDKSEDEIEIVPEVDLEEMILTNVIIY